MNIKKFSDAMGRLDGRYINEVLSYKRRAIKTAWLKWGAAAACLCLIITGAAVILRQNLKESDAGAEGGGEGSYSVAVYPAGESIQNVAFSEVVSLTENAALNTPLAKRLPRQLPKGFHYGSGSIYNTVMKDGTQYNMLRIEYISGTIPEQQFTEDGGAIAIDPEIMGERFTIYVMNFEPETSVNIYSSIDEITASILAENGAAYFRSGDYCIGGFLVTTEPTTISAVLEVLKSMD